MLGQLSLEPPDKTLPLRRRVTLAIVSLADAGDMLRRFHYLHRTRVGRQINYAVSIDGVVDGVITYAYPMMSAPLDGVPSDELLEFARLYLHSNIPHTATCAIGQSLKRIRRDWSRLFPDAKPVRMVVSWSDTTRHTGTIYKAANFRWLRRCLGQNHGNAATSKRGARTKHNDYVHDKDCWVYRFPTQGRQNRGRALPDERGTRGSQGRVGSGGRDDCILTT